VRERHTSPWLLPFAYESYQFPLVAVEYGRPGRASHWLIMDANGRVGSWVADLCAMCERAALLTLR